MIETTSSKPKLSVGIPLYNKAPYIKRAIDSVLSQTVQDFELIVVGGNSTDGGEEIVKSYSDSRIRFIQETGKGVSAARNQVIAVSKAKYIAYLDADDAWDCEFLKTILELISKYPDSGVYGTGSTYYSPDGNKHDKLLQPELGPRILSSYFWSKNHFVGLIINPSSAVFNKEILKSIGGGAENMRRSEDEDLFARVAYVSDVAYSPLPLVFRYTDTLNNSDDIYSDMDSPFLEEIYLKYSTNNLVHPDRKNIIQYADRLRTGIAIRYLHSDKKKAWEHIKKIISKKYKYPMIAIYALVKMHLVTPKMLSKLVEGRRVKTLS